MARPPRPPPPPGAEGPRRPRDAARFAISTLGAIRVATRALGATRVSARAFGATRVVAPAALGLAVAFFAAGAARHSAHAEPQVAPSAHAEPQAAPPARAEPQAAPPARAEPRSAPPERAGTQWFVSGASRTPVLVYPPRDRAAPRPVVLHLHSYCWHPVDECPLMQPGASQTHWLLCPRATARCANGGFSRAGGFSHGAGTAALVDETLATFAAAFPDDAREPAVLSGFSQGAYAAARLAQSAAPGRFSHLLLIAANVTLDPERLRRAGVRSVLLAAGESDGTRAAMAREAKRLEGLGYRAAFRSLGRIGHDFPPNMSDWVRDALAWFRAPAEPAP